MLRKFFPCFALAMVAAATAGSAHAQRLATVTLSARILSAGGIQTVVLQPAHRAFRTTAYGVVLDPGPLIALSAQIAAARSKFAAAQASTALARSEATRAAHLYHARHNISQAAFQVAQSRLQVALADQPNARAQLDELQARARTGWGAALAAAIGAGTTPLPQLARGARQLVEASVPIGQSLPALPSSAHATTPDGKRVALHLIGRAPRAAAGVTGPGLYYLMPAQDSAPIGTPLTVALDGPGVAAGVLVPASAVVWHNGQALVYRQTGGASFVPVVVPASWRTTAGYFVPSGKRAALRAGQRIVATGAALLYSASQSPAVKAKPAKAETDDD